MVKEATWSTSLISEFAVAQEKCTYAREVMIIMCHISTTKKPMSKLVTVQRLSNHIVSVVGALSCMGRS